MKKIVQFLFILTFVVHGYSQGSIEEYVKEGIAYHDNGEFTKAIECYKKALEIDPESALVNYEISISYLSNKDYKLAVEYSDYVLNKKGENLLAAYITKGSALDMLGETEESIKVFEEAINKTEGHYLLHYNLALNYYKLNKLEVAEKHLMNGLELNVNHASSHLMLVQIHFQLGNKVQTVLAAHYFLFLEPNSNRSLGAYTMMQDIISADVSKDADNPNNTNITINLSEDDPFGPITMLISLLEASRVSKENEGKTEDEIFIETTKSIFSMIGVNKEEERKGIWWEFYIPFFSDLYNSDHLETYCKYITQSKSDNSIKWLEENESKIVAFGEWLER